MRRFFLFSAVVAVIVFSSAACGRKGKVIPRGKMAEIYAMMFVVDERISSDANTRRMADTLLVYEPVFEKFGYTADDYRRSMAYYIKDPDRYARILKESVVILEDRLQELKAERVRLESISQSKAITESYRPERIFYLSGLANRDLLTVDSVTFYIDSTGTGSYDFDVQKGYDTLFVGPKTVILTDTLALDRDSSAVSSEPEGGVMSVRKVMNGKEAGAEKLNPLQPSDQGRQVARKISPNKEKI